MYHFSTSAASMRSSDIRAMMNLAANPDIISFAGGMPNNGLFPIEQVDEIFSKLPDNIKRAGFQYGPTPGYPPLLESLADFLQKKGLPVDTNRLMITTGSLQAINLITKVFIDPGDRIITEYPSFIGAIAAFKSYQASIETVSIDNDGINIDELNRALAVTSPPAKLLYITPYFHNPAGIIYSKQRKNELLSAIQGKPTILLEDDAYGELYFDEKDKELAIPLKAITKDTEFICYTSSFSKYMGPGLRIGWLLAPPAIAEKCELAKQSMDACTPQLSQVLAHEFLVQNKMSPYLAMLRKEYAARCRIMLQALEQYMPEGTSWTTPKGGFYIWVTLPEKMDATKLLKETIPQGAVFVGGSTFDPLGKRNNCLRLAFSHTPQDRIEKGIKIIADVIKADMIKQD